MRTAAFRLSLLFIFFIPWEEAVILPGIGTLSRLVGIILGLTWLASVITQRRLRMLRPIHGVIALFVFWNAFSVFWSVNPGSSLQQSQTYFQYFAMVMVVWDLYRTEAALHAGIQAFVLGAYVSVFNIVNNFVSASEDISRYTGSGFNPNMIGFILALAVPMAWFLFTQAETRSVAWSAANIMYIPLGFAAIALTGSRAAALSLVPVAAYLIFSPARHSIRVRVSALAVVALVVVVALPLIPGRPIDRILSTGADDATTELGGRLDIWSEGWNTFLDHPIGGVGTRGFRSSDDKVAHNFVIGSLAEVGMVGFGLFAAVLLLSARDAFRAPRSYRALWMVSLVIWFAVALTHNLEARKVTWLLISLIACSGRIVEQQPPRRSGSKLTGGGERAATRG